MSDSGNLHFFTGMRFDLDILFLPGLGSGIGTQSSFVEDLRACLPGARIHVPNIEKMDRRSIDSIIRAILREFPHLRNLVIIGHSLGGLLAIYLARLGFASTVISISTALPSNFMQIDFLRIRIFLRTLITGKPFRFTESTIKEHLMQFIPEELIQECIPHFRYEPASLVREMARMGTQLRLTDDDVEHLQKKVRGLIITGMADQICPASQQQELARMLAFRHEFKVCGHSPHLGSSRQQVLHSIYCFLAPFATYQKIEEVS